MGRDASPFGSAAEAQTPPASAPQLVPGSDPFHRLLERRLVQQRALAEFARRALRAPALDPLLAEGAALLRRFPAGSAESPPDDDDDRAFVDAVTDVVDAARGRLRAVEVSRLAALHDPLTGLANRALIMDHLDLALRRAGRRATLAAVIFIDLDNFKRVNDSLGHLAGDELLVRVAERLRSAVRPADTVGRWGGDEFVAVCDELRPADVPVLVERIAAAFELPFRIQERDLSVVASIGVAMSSGIDDPAALIAAADSEMYRSKRHHSARRRHQPEMSALPVGVLATKQERLTLRLCELLSSLEPDTPAEEGRGRPQRAADPVGRPTE